METKVFTVLRDNLRDSSLRTNRAEYLWRNKEWAIRAR